MNEHIASLYIAARPPYEPKPHIPAKSTVESKRQRRAKRRDIERRGERALKQHRRQS